MGPEAVVLKNITKEKRTWGTKTPGYMLSKDNHLILPRLGTDLVGGAAPMDHVLLGENLGCYQFLELRVRGLGLAPVGRDSR